MSDTTRNALRWTACILAVLTALFLGLFALDALQDGLRWHENARRLAAHLAPSFVLLLTALVAWRRARVGAAVFLSLAALYAVLEFRQPQWVLVISGPLALTGAAYLLSWSASRRREEG